MNTTETLVYGTLMIAVTVASAIISWNIAGAYSGLVFWIAFLGIWGIIEGVLMYAVFILGRLVTSIGLFVLEIFQGDED